MDPELDDRTLARITVDGAAREVTGSRLRVRTRRSRVLIDCGMVQGGRHADRRNAEDWPFAPEALDAVVLTHAHIDHSGLLPRLVRDGFRGRIHATRGTRDLLRIMWPDAAWIQKHDTDRANRRRAADGRDPVAPLYTVEDVERALELVRAHDMGATVPVTEDIEATFRHAGHILGAASVRLAIRDVANVRHVLVSGDLGHAPAPFMRPPLPATEADLVVMESTYGDHAHRDFEATLAELVEILDDARSGGGNVIVPVFAVGRAQEFLWVLAELERTGRIAPRPVYLDSPMAIDVTELYARHPDAFDAERFARGMHPADLTFSHTGDDSRELNHTRGAIILSASGMCDAGRILFHLKHHLPDSSTHLVVVGFQADGSLGHALVHGAESVRILGHDVPVRAKVHTLGGFSAHADQPGLLRWLDGARRADGSWPPVALVHGEPEAQAPLGAEIERRIGRAPLVPERGAVLELPRSGRAALVDAAR